MSLFSPTTTLSPSPVSEAFAEIRWDKLDVVLDASEKSILKAGEENVLEYTLGRQDDASHYTLLLLKILNATTTSSSGGTAGGGGGSSGGGAGGRGGVARSNSMGGKRRLSQLPLDQVLPTDEALVLLELDTYGVMAHYAVSKLYLVISTLSAGFSKNCPTTIASIFYPDGFLLEDWRPLHRILMTSTSSSAGGGSDAYLQRGSAFVLVSILVEGILLARQHRLFQPVTSVLESFVSWTTSRLQSASSKSSSSSASISGASSSSSSSSGGQSLAIVTPSLVVLITMKEARAIFDKAGGIGYISRHLKIRHHHVHNHSHDIMASSGGSGTNLSDPGTWTASTGSGSLFGGTSVQQLYELCFCLWLLSFDVNGNDDAAEQRRKHFHRDGAIPALVDIVAAAPREKVVRVALATLCNLANCSTTDSLDVAVKTAAPTKNVAKKKGTEAAHFLNEMIACGIVRTIDLLKEGKKYNDPEIADDIKLLSGLLHDAFTELTRWELYEAEVEAGHLQWGVLHTEKFFAENAKLMEGQNGNFDIVKKLVHLASSDDEEVAAIACFDLGEFARHYPNGRAIAKRLLARNVVMSLIEHDHPELQKQALACISKMLVQNWRSIG